MATSSSHIWEALKSRAGARNIEQCQRPKAQALSAFSNAYRKVLNLFIVSYGRYAASFRMKPSGAGRNRKKRRII